VIPQGENLRDFLNAEVALLSRLPPSDHEPEVTFGSPTLVERLRFLIWGKTSQR
jgi:hypothetical protein